MYEKDWMYVQSGVVPFKFEEGELKILLITSRGRRRWIIPKGIVESDMTPQESAENEAFEEAGVRGVLRPESIGEFRFHKWGGEVTVTVFLLEVKEELDAWPEASFRQRKWIRLDEAEGLVERKELRNLLLDLPSVFLARGLI